jgi:3-oxoacyl-[acyl-carrier-protein] synthase III
MGKKEKLLAKAKDSPQNISFQELESLASAYGLPLKQGRGGSSHYIQRLPDVTKNTIVREGKKVKKWYVQDVVEAIETFGRKQEKEVNNEGESRGAKRD